MKKTDYSKIAERYDKNKIRHMIERDEIIGKLPCCRDLRVLDLGCGTGNYLQAQTKYFPNDQKRSIFWFGADASEDMLAVARAKKIPAEFHSARAEELPYEDGLFDYIICRFAFHHFTEKPAALKEIARVLRIGGKFHLENMLPEESNDWLLYKYFPTSKKFDTERFWPISKLLKTLEELGLKPQVKKIPVPTVKLSDFHEEMSVRDVSHLNLISDEEYEKGMKKLEEDLQITKSEVPFGLTLISISACR
jgi:ubiquinone/menaquinone biosynthesis C-methylase UbiE